MSSGIELSGASLTLIAGLWLLLLAGLFVFVVLAFKSKRQNVEQDKIIQTQRAHIQRLASVENTPAEAAERRSELGPGDSANDPEEAVDVPSNAVDTESNEENLLPADEEEGQLTQERFDQLESDCIRLQEELTQLSVESETLRGKLNGIKQLNEQITQENKQLDKKLKLAEEQIESLTESLAINDESVMKEMIVNFTEESRALLEQIDILESEKSRLQQFIEDSESGEKATTGTVVGLKRKLEEAESQISELELECRSLRAAVSSA